MKSPFSNERGFLFYNMVAGLVEAAGGGIGNLLWLFEMLQSVAETSNYINYFCLQRNIIIYRRMQLQVIQTKIYEVREQKVMLDYDIAELYEVETRILNQAVKRNIDLFPQDFMFQITLKEWENMSSQFVMTSVSKRPKTFLPLVFTEHGVTMLAMY